MTCYRSASERWTRDPTADPDMRFLVRCPKYFSKYSSPRLPQLKAHCVNGNILHACTYDTRDDNLTILPRQTPRCTVCQPTSYKLRLHRHVVRHNDIIAVMVSTVGATVRRHTYHQNTAQTPEPAIDPQFASSRCATPHTETDAALEHALPREMLASQERAQLDQSLSGHAIKFNHDDEDRMALVRLPPSK